MIISYDFVLCIVSFMTIIQGFPIEVLSGNKQNFAPPPSKVLDFMTHYGYLEKSDGESEALYTEEGISNVIKLIQRHGAIPETGILDNTTLKLMASPRCGVADIQRTRRKRFVLGSEGWNKREITYFIANWSPRLGKKIVSKNIKIALDTWGRYGRLTFREVFSPDADIIVAFGRGYHGDRYPFDGPGLILAHAFFPYEESSLGGDIHFDDDEKWNDIRNEVVDDNGIDFLTVALHELGHSLGLSHSLSPNAVMFPYYKGFDPDEQIQLAYDDILGMYELYIRRNIKEDVNQTYQFETTTPFTTEKVETSTITTESSVDTSTYTELSTRSTVMYEGDYETVDIHKNHDSKHSIPSLNSPSLPDICQGFYDVVAALRNELFIFKDHYIWRLKEPGQILPGYPILIRQMFPQLPKYINKIDAAYERLDGMIILFIGENYWTYDGQDFINSPRPLTDYGLPTYLDRVDAVQLWGRNGKLYFYRKDRYWRYNEHNKTLEEGPLRIVERWRGIPEDLNAAMTWKDGVTYFFKDELYWRFDNLWIQATDESPLPAPQKWLGCPEDENTFTRL